MRYKRTQTKVGQYRNKNTHLAVYVLPFDMWNKSKLRHGGLFSVPVTQLFLMPVTGMSKPILYFRT